MTGRRTAARERGVLHHIGVGLSCGLLALVIGLGLAAIVVPAVAGATPLTVLTTSMEPTYPPGTLVIVKPIDSGDIRIGDPVTYQIESGKPDLVTHRVVAIAKTTAGGISFTTRGDNNAVADPNPVTVEQIRGKVWYSIPWVGYVNSAVGGANRAWLLPVFAVILFGYAGWMFVGGFIARGRRREEARKRAASAQPTDS